ncbi:MAG: oligopeptide ABC transporter permease OppB [Gammaproteobacteria bacterium]|jgi:oligopeptide transport system permease protein|uniref:Oligopeptide transport system permease protein n=1 Tax=Marinomonas polaris DSM 16579 TaxID=1122206 RepID=A0A1M5B3A4_9GAMM|nr:MULTISPECIES: oligopeptide ABC transporter permease OppB [Marinomonas]MBU1294618.1 oligopeptide ABC transporter permease OppB [Gammaproteobacteria bacterium]MBU1465221.1 oligopeptide ABC transporter permease OppB [Gammaproteobacteria bacterium]MBU2020976.1 oligopeptide ABC transporter permease OppB [Gammaproteobacteria bacterium]MBU2238035.1 oligopeptide ABC transporter permease OppB [Gammaproteobacteria bacterium]MBU2320074.1 oligopeptide ABC transporter permease OppB [Gammaproteobacteria 
MLTFISKRILEAIPTLLILITVSFFLMHSAPGSPFSSERTLPPEVLANINAKYHLDEPVINQYFYYLGGLLQGDLGPSFRYKDFTINELIAQSFPVSAEIGIWSFLVALLIGVGCGIIAALRQNSWLDYGVMGFANLGIVLPNFVLAPLCILFFSIYNHWLPPGGWNGGAWPYLVMPVIAMSTSYIAQIARITRGSMIETMHSNFIRTARAKGLPKYRIIFQHALRPAMLPVVSYLGPAFVGIVTGSVIVDVYFGTGGIGQHFINGALNRDYSMVMGVTILVGTLTILFNAIVDILYAVIDPKIRY